MDLTSDEPAWAADVLWEPRAARAAQPAAAGPPVRPRGEPAADRPTARAMGVMLAVLAAVAVAARGLDQGTSPAPAAPRVASPRSSPAHAASASPRRGAPSPRLRAGDTGAPVLALQTALAALKLDPGPQDGAFGAQTRTAVAGFQAAHGLPADGVVGQTTAKAIVKALGASVRADAAAAQAGFERAEAAGRLPAAAAHAAKPALAAAVARAGSGHIGQAALVAAALHDVAAQADVYDGPRARALFGMLAANVDRAASGGVPAAGASIEDGDGVVYRYFPGHGLQFHPLASFAALNADVTQGRTADTRRLADAMVARGIPTGDALVWEYDFDFGGAQRWTSGFAQAVGADALARAGRLLEDPKLAAAAGKAFAAIPASYLTPAGGGEWTREYSQNHLLILNAQLQTYLSLSDYARVSGDGEARRVAGELLTAARALLPRFDAGCWSRYSLGGALATSHYDAYHVRLLRQVARVTGDRSWASIADRWQQGLEHGGCQPG